ncbi:predicted protein [Histoplasma mississippiense (nom. inval.)]|uniref:predicted protein n=1 Tax=Ajellomyces capsulatus (strain NAm1 / WU24) TaxID=2059318 RepID=UPI000157CF3C|nr:predicted protein [Histoplasma mississippiense (nom. inval.)]EDN04397.1 predicted protein [Histoplasma mississippiense (nom. inval.)]
MLDSLITLFFSFLLLTLRDLLICISHMFDCKVVILNLTLSYSIEFRLFSIVFEENSYEEAVIEQFD